MNALAAPRPINLIATIERRLTETKVDLSKFSLNAESCGSFDQSANQQSADVDWLFTHNVVAGTPKQIQRSEAQSYAGAYPWG
jgi:hypothetical protein